MVIFSNRYLLKWTLKKNEPQEFVFLLKGDDIIINKVMQYVQNNETRN
jgi:hypothetical protein